MHEREELIKKNREEIGPGWMRFWMESFFNNTNDLEFIGL